MCVCVSKNQSIMRSQREASRQGEQQYGGHWNNRIMLSKMEKSYYLRNMLSLWKNKGKYSIELKKIASS
jgi:hypothetical protein